ncbi:hypothetical protein CQ046_05380 [Chryseobacterium sp. MYb7]|uniref:hypothetical protein n=1 Tax=Chryseobacterium sp. MYb7 TaxID=1827290 RepID=UPI000D002408|nr:hypothetical protein [Chryseobacterium sp. MYb7]PRB05286.1 hypothetical protein CQ046_05380 [Chryseobacterium sp. MYb7]
MVYILNYKTAIVLFFFLFLKHISKNLYFFDKNNNGWSYADWLINYQDGGFKRRGLGGTFFIYLHDITNIPLYRIVYFTQFSIYLIFFIYFILLLYKKKLSPLYLTLIFTPLTFLFYYFDIYIIGRKEIIFITLYAVFIYYTSSNNYRGKKEVLVIGLLFLFSFFHEIIIFYIPYFIFSLYYFDVKNKLRKSLAYLLACVLPTAFFFFIGSKINNGKSLQILKKRGVVLSKGNIFDWDENLNTGHQIMSQISDYGLYGLSFIIVFAVFTYYICTKTLNSKKILLGFIFCCIITIPLFINAIDWGRWLHIHFMMLLLFLTSILPTQNLEKSEIILNKEFFISLLIVLLLSVFHVRHCQFGFLFNLINNQP